MQLPENAVGVSDILDWRECAQRMGWKMRRHVELPERFQLFEGEKDEPPEATDWTNAYGSAFHDAVAIVEQESVADEVAIERVWPTWGHYLDPDDLVRLRSDLEAFHTRSELGYKPIAIEQDMRVPLFVHEGTQMYYRFKVDALYQRIDNPSVFLFRDYKSSRHQKSEAEIHNDVQMWAYSWAIHEMFPEAETVIVLYDQLRFGVTPTQKNAAQRAQIKDWLIEQVKAILADDVMAPTMNDWCAYCPLLGECRVTHRASKWWLDRLEAVAPTGKQGRKIVMELGGDFSEHAARLPEVRQAVKMLKRYEETVKETLKEMPQERREALGYEVREGSMDRFPPDALRRVLQLVGPEEFIHLASLSKSALEAFYGRGDERYEEIVRLAERGAGKVEVRPLRGA